MPMICPPTPNISRGTDSKPVGSQPGVPGPIPWGLQSHCFGWGDPFPALLPACKSVQRKGDMFYWLPFPSACWRRAMAGDRDWEWREGLLHHGANPCLPTHPLLHACTSGCRWAGGVPIHFFNSAGGPQTEQSWEPLLWATYFLQVSFFYPYRDRRLRTTKTWMTGMSAGKYS